VSLTAKSIRALQEVMQGKDTIGAAREAIKRSRELVLALREDGVISEGRVSEWVTEDGRMTPEGARQIENVIVGMLVPDQKMNHAMALSIRDKLIRVAPAILRAEAVHPGIVVDNMRLAIVSDIRRAANNENVNEFISTNPLADASPSQSEPLVAQLHRALAADGSGGMTSLQAVAAFARLAERVELRGPPEQGTMFTDQLARDSDIYDDAFGTLDLSRRVDKADVDYSIPPILLDQVKLSEPRDALKQLDTEVPVTLPVDAVARIHEAGYDVLEWTPKRPVMNEGNTFEFVPRSGSKLPRFTVATPEKLDKILDALGVTTPMPGKGEGAPAPEAPQPKGPGVSETELWKRVTSPTVLTAEDYNLIGGGKTTANKGQAVKILQHMGIGIHEANVKLQDGYERIGNAKVYKVKDVVARGREYLGIKLEKPQKPQETPKAKFIKTYVHNASGNQFRRVLVTDGGREYTYDVKIREGRKGEQLLDSAGVKEEALRRHREERKVVEKPGRDHRAMGPEAELPNADQLAQPNDSPKQKQARADALRDLTELLQFNEPGQYMAFRPEREIPVWPAWESTTGEVYHLGTAIMTHERLMESMGRAKAEDGKWRRGFLVRESGAFLDKEAAREAFGRSEPTEFLFKESATAPEHYEGAVAPSKREQPVGVRIGVTLPSGATMETTVRGVNQADALYRAYHKYEGAEIEVRQVYLDVDASSDARTEQNTMGPGTGDRQAAERSDEPSSQWSPGPKYRGYRDAAATVRWDAPLPRGAKYRGEIMHDLARDLSMPVQEARMRAHGKHMAQAVAGFYRPGSGLMVLRYFGDLQVYAHELGHGLADKHRQIAELLVEPAPGQPREAWDQMRSVSYDDRTDVENGKQIDAREGSAEMFRLWLTQSAYAKAEVPAAWKELDKAIRSLPKRERKALLKAQKEMHEYFSLQAIDQMDLAFGPDGKPRSGVLADPSDIVAQNLVDDFHGILMAEEIVRRAESGQPVRPRGMAGIRQFAQRGSGAEADSVYAFWRRLRGIPQLTGHLFRVGTPEWGPGYKSLKWSGEGVQEILKGVARDDLMLRRFLQYATARRAEMLALKNKEHRFSAQMIKDGLELANRYEAGLFAETAQKLVDFNSRIMDFAQSSGLVSRKLRKMIDDSGDFYVFGFFREMHAAEHGFRTRTDPLGASSGTGSTAARGT
jgi:hypothetical protein